MPTTNSESVPPDAVAAALVDAFVSAGKVVMPAGRRQDVIALLTRLMVNAELRDAYCRAVAAERRRLGVDRTLSERGDSGDIPDRAIARDGFGILTDEQLADYAIDPDAVAAVAGRLNGDDLTEDLGDWFIQAGIHEQARRPDDPTRSDRARRLLDAIHRTPDRTNGATRTDRTDTTATAPSTLTPRPTRWIKVAVPFAVAASLLLGLFLGSQLGGRNRQPEFALANVEVRGDPARGIADIDLLVTNSGDSRAFVTVVGLFPGNKGPEVFNRRTGERNFLTLAPHATAGVKPLPPEFEGASTTLVILTSVPAGEAVRQSLPGNANSEQAGDVAGRLRAALEELGIRCEIRVAALPVEKR